MNQNIYDDPGFFAGYRELRADPRNYNLLLDHPALEGMLPSLAGKRVLDLGCGFGESCLHFLQLGAAEVVGVDLSQQMLETAQQEHSRPGIRYLHGDMTQLPEELGEFDCIVSSLAFHYIEDLPALLRNLYRRLRPGGVLLYSQEHPLTTAPMAGAEWEHDESGKRTHYILTDYGRSGLRSTRWFVDGVEKYHRTFSEILGALLGSGFLLEETAEPMPGADALGELPQMASEWDKPSFLILRARRG